MRALRLLLLGIAAMGPWLATPASAAPPPLVIRTLLTAPDRVSGGDVLVRIDVPAAVSLASVQVTLNSKDVTSVFLPDSTSHLMHSRGLSGGR